MSSVRRDVNSTNIIREGISFTPATFDTESFPDDVQRVYDHLKAKYDENYALLFVFTMNTAIELHRAWHMTLLTSKILQQIKDKFGLIMNWDLGVIKLRIRVEDGGYELHRRVPYDYDSENQDLYMRIAVALIEGQIDVREALKFQTEVKLGLHTAKSGLFLRNYPGRLILYPLEAATCAVIFFGGNWRDAWVAAITGLVSGLIEYAFSSLGGDIKILVDITVGFSTGLIGGLFYSHVEKNCLPAIFLGTLYWFFYGTAFVIGLLEIIAGQLETGVTRFMAVSIKTFVLSLGAGLGLMVATSSSASEYWYESQADSCQEVNLDEVWWRIPLYLLSSASALGQYRLPIVQYWRGLTVQLAAYEVQYQAFKHYDHLHDRDNLDTSSSNILGAAAAVVTACFMSFLSKKVRFFYTMRVYQKGRSKNTKIGDFIFGAMKYFIKLVTCVGLGRESDLLKLSTASKLRKQRRELHDPTHERKEIKLSEKDENLILEAIVGAQDLNVWSILMPALYQLVPGSMIAKLWFNAIFPTDTAGTGQSADPEFSVFSNLMVISTSLALGLMIGFVLVQIFAYAYFNAFQSELTTENKNAMERMQGMYCEPVTALDDPEAEVDGDDMNSAIRDHEITHLSNRDCHIEIPVGDKDNFTNEEKS